MAVDREETLKRAEKLLRQGRLDGAIQEYERLVDDQPRDWNAINALGDLYARAGDHERAIAQFIRIADHLHAEGFLPKAAALFKKALKVKSDHEHTLLQLADIATRQSLLADARMYLGQLSQHRTARGDARGAAECAVRLGLLDDADASAKLAAARASQSLGDTARAVGLFKAAADHFTTNGRADEALDALVEAGQLDPSDVVLRGRLARECLAAGRPHQAKAFLSAESVGDDPDLLLTLATMNLAEGRDQEAHAAILRALTCAPDRCAVVVGMAQDLAARGRVESAYACIEILADAALLEGDYPRAAAVLRDFARACGHVPALTRLVDVCVDAGLEPMLYEAQGMLADAYLESGGGSEARVIAEDLLLRDPDSDANRQRLHRALELLGVADVERVVAQCLQAGRDNGDVLDLSDASLTAATPSDEPATDDDSKAPSSPESPPLPTPVFAPRAGDDEVIVVEALEIDLSDEVSRLMPASVDPPSPRPLAAPAAVLPPEPAAAPRDLEDVFSDMRARVQGGDRQTSAGSDHYDLAERHLQHGRVDDAITALQSASRAPQMRFKAAAQLGRLLLSRGDLHGAVEWLERAAEAPAATADEGFAVLYDLADGLERMGETARALAVLIEIETDAGGFRDVPGRIARLSQAQAESPGA